MRSIRLSLRAQPRVSAVQRIPRLYVALSGA